MAIAVTKELGQGTIDRMTGCYSLGWPALPFNEIFHSTLCVPSDTEKKNSLARADSMSTYVQKNVEITLTQHIPVVFVSWWSIRPRTPSRRQPIAPCLPSSIPLACSEASCERESSPPALASEFHTAHNTLVHSQTSSRSLACCLGTACRWKHCETVHWLSCC